MPLSEYQQAQLKKVVDHLREIDKTVDHSKVHEFVLSMDRETAYAVAIAAERVLKNP